MCHEDRCEYFHVPAYFSGFCPPCGFYHPDPGWKWTDRIFQHPFRHGSADAFVHSFRWRNHFHEWSFLSDPLLPGGWIPMEYLYRSFRTGAGSADTDHLHDHPLPLSPGNRCSHPVSRYYFQENGTCDRCHAARIWRNPETGFWQTVQLYLQHRVRWSGWSVELYRRETGTDHPAGIYLNHQAERKWI